MEVRATSSITSAAASAIVRAAVAEATQHGAPVTVAVVGPGGELLAFERMDGTADFSTRFAIAKATTSAAFGRPTADMEELFEGRHAFAVGFLAKGDWMVARGGAPVLVDGAVVGAVGISGNSAEVEDDLARRLAAG